MKSYRLLLALSGLLLGATAAHAHRVWILPSMTVVSGNDQWISFEAAVSNNLFFPNHRPVAIDSLEVRGPDGQPVSIQNATSGQIRTSFELQLQKQGTYVVSLKPNTGGRGRGGPAGPAVAQAAAPGAPAAAGRGGRGGRGGGAGSLNGTYEENGQVVRWNGTPETLVSEAVAKKTNFKLTENGGRTVVAFVTAGKPTTEVLKPTGKGIEIDYVTHPNDLFTGEEATFRLLVDGKPAANAEVTVVRGDDRYRDEAGDVILRTAADGTVKIKWPQSGRYWLEAVATGTGELHGVPSQKTFTYISTYEVLPN